MDTIQGSAPRLETLSGANAGPDFAQQLNGLIAPSAQIRPESGEPPANLLSPETLLASANGLSLPDISKLLLWGGKEVKTPYFERLGVNGFTAYFVTRPGTLAQNLADPDGAANRPDPNIAFATLNLAPEARNAVAISEVLRTLFGEGSMVNAARGAMLLGLDRLNALAANWSKGGLAVKPIISVSAPFGETMKMVTGQSPKVETRSPLPASSFSMGLVLSAGSGKKPGPIGSGASIFFSLGEQPNPKGDNSPASTYSLTVGVTSTEVKLASGMPPLKFGASIPTNVSRVNGGPWELVKPDKTREPVPVEVANILNAATGQNAPIIENTVSLQDFLARVGLPPEALEAFGTKIAPVLDEAMQLGTMITTAGSLPVPFGVFPLVGYLLNKAQQLDEATTRELAKQFIAQGGLSPSKLAAQLPAEMSTPELTAAANLLSKAIDLNLEGNPGDREKLKDIWSVAAKDKNDTRIAVLGTLAMGDLRGASELAAARNDPLGHIGVIAPLKGIASSLAPDQRIEGYAGAQTPQGDYAQVAVGILPEKAAFAMLSPPGRNLPPVELFGSTLEEAQQEARRLIEKEEGNITNYYQPIPGKPPLGTPAPAENFLDGPTTVSHRPAVVLGLGSVKVVEDTTNGKFFAVGKAGQPYLVEPAHYPDEAIATVQQMMLDGRIPKDDIIPQN